MVEWENIACCLKPNEVISNIDFWNSYLDSKDRYLIDSIEFEGKKIRMGF